MFKTFGLVLFYAATPLLAADIEVMSKDKGVLSSRDLSHFKELFNLSSFLETGTYAGDTTAEASKIFGEVHSIEIFEPLHEKARERFAQSANVHLYLGDTSHFLAHMIQNSSSSALLA